MTDGRRAPPHGYRPFEGLNPKSVRCQLQLSIQPPATERSGPASGHCRVSSGGAGRFVRLDSDSNALFKPETPSAFLFQHYSYHLILVVSTYAMRFEGNCCNQAWLLKNSFEGISTSKFVCK